MTNQYCRHYSGSMQKVSRMFEKVTMTFMKKNTTTILCRRFAVLVVLLFCLVGAVAATCDLTITGTVNPVPSSAVFAKETNPITITNVKNNGPDAATNIVVSLYASDVSSGTVPVNTTTIASLANGGTITLNLVDPTIRNLEGGSVTYNATVDPGNLIAETNEANNNKTSTTIPVKFNGYKGKRYWQGGSDIITKKTYDLNGGVVYSTQPESTYQGVGWATRTETWANSEFSAIPSGATIEKVWLFVSYNWDTTPGGVPDWTATFNNTPISITPGTPYTDKKNFGTYSDNKYGLYTVDVTNLYNRSGDNKLVMTSNSGNSQALYPSTLVVIYRHAGSTRKQIFINEECDELGYSESSYGTTMAEATAYAPFTGMTIDTSKVQSATLHSFAGGAGPGEGNLLFNGATVATNAWQGTPNTASAKVFDIKSYLTATGNEAGVQATQSGGMLAIQQILVVEYQPVAPSIEITLGSSTVKLTNMVPGQDASNQTTVNVVASNGNSWSIKASDEKTTNKGFMVKGSTPLSSAFQLGKNDGDYRALTSDYTSFMSGSTMGSHSATANLKQPVVEGDASGTYGITVTFTGSIS